ncbi:MAG: Cytochrome c bioproteinis protein transmembrane region [Microgenomates group bacterium Gr01-1014_16]|nr:MAG: Cytochrome c bioproteinis protein transmembrane region [Microgenomates group bacterium Gr01-1014_16]
MDLLFSASIVASFLAGLAALFAPCCITVLLPTYLASVFKQKSTVFLMTFIYFLGLVAVFLPLGLGATFLTRIFSDYHDQVFIVGGIILTLLGILLISGKSISLPVNIHPKLQKTDALSVFGLGIFSGIATMCCAPVLAGVLALSALPGSYLLGAVFTLAYVLGMVAPLFILAAVMDKSGATTKLMALRKPVFGKVTLSNLISGIMFLGLGLIILNKARTSQLTMHTSYQLSVNLAIAGLTEKIGLYTRILPEPVWAILTLLAVSVIVIIAVRQWRQHE